jgi:hypothetical protein
MVLNVPEFFSRFSNRVSSFFFISGTIHLLLAFGMYLYLYAWPEQEHYVATVALYTGEGETDRETTGKGKGDKNTEKDKKSSDTIGTGPASSSVDWGTAADPSVDGGSRYAPDIWVDGSLEDMYPARAKQANLGRVVVAVTLYIDGSGRIRDVRIRYVRSQGNAHAPFEADFRQAAYDVATKRMRLRSAAYRHDGRPVDFIWDTTINFQLQ